MIRPYIVHQISQISVGTVFDRKLIWPSSRCYHDSRCRRSKTCFWKCVRDNIDIINELKSHLRSGHLKCLPRYCVDMQPNVRYFLFLFYVYPCCLVLHQTSFHITWIDNRTAQDMLRSIFFRHGICVIKTKSFDSVWANCRVENLKLCTESWDRRLHSKLFCRNKIYLHYLIFLDTALEI